MPGLWEISVVVVSLLSIFGPKSLPHLGTSLDTASTTTSLVRRPRLSGS